MQNQASVIEKRQTFSDEYTPNCDLSHTDWMEISLIEKGSGIHRIFGKSVPCSAGEIYIVAPNILHGFFASDSGDPVTVRSVCINISEWFAGDCIKEDSDHYCFGVFSEGALAYANLTKQTVKEIESLIDGIIKEQQDKHLEWREVIKAKLSLIFITIRRCLENTVKSTSNFPPKERATVSSVIRMMEERLGEADLTLDSIAADLFISPSNLSRIFRQYMGQSFSDFIRSFRMDRACRLLAETDEPVSDIVGHCGLKDVPSFYRAFSRHTGTTPSQYRNRVKNSNPINKKGESNMSILNEISENLQRGKSKIVKELVQKALDEGINAKVILEEGLISGMNVVGERFKNNEIYIPEVLVAARALNQGTTILKPFFTESGVTSVGRVCIGTVQGDLHDIGKNLVKMMMEGKQLEVIDLGTDVPAEEFIKAAVEQNCQVICCSALLTTTMGVMKDVVDAADAAGIRDKVKIMIGGAPVNEEFCKKIGADVYTVDAASASDAAVELCKAFAE